jgi:hypothetical protein
VPRSSQCAFAGPIKYCLSSLLSSQPLKSQHCATGGDRRPARAPILAPGGNLAIHRQPDGPVDWNGLRLEGLRSQADVSAHNGPAVCRVDDMGVPIGWTDCGASETASRLLCRGGCLGMELHRQTPPKSAGIVATEMQNRPRANLLTSPETIAHFGCALTVGQGKPGRRGGQRIECIMEARAATWRPRDGFPSLRAWATLIPLHTS